ncbi:MAG: hypothetical protein ACK46L_02285, partial [Synechococcaceae cyanobacterium]
MVLDQPVVRPNFNLREPAAAPASAGDQFPRLLLDPRMDPSATTVPAAAAIPARILVVGSGGRENALGWALARCPAVERVWIAPG